MQINKTQVLKQLLATIFFLFVSYPTYASDPDNEANALFVEAVETFSSVTPEARPEDRFSAYSEAVAHLEAIITDHPKSALAVSLISGQNIGSVNLERYRNARQKALAEVEAINLALDTARKADQQAASAKEQLAIQHDIYIRSASKSITESAQFAGMDLSFLYIPADQVPAELEVYGINNWQNVIPNAGAGSIVYLLGEGPEYGSDKLLKFAFKFVLGDHFDGKLRLDELELDTIHQDGIILIGEPRYGTAFQQIFELFDFEGQIPVVLDGISVQSN